MRRPGLLRASLSCAAVTALSTGLVALGGGAADASHRARPMPDHVAAPYFEAWTGESPAALAAASGNKYLTMAFLQAEAPGSCTAYWNGQPAQPIAKSTFGEDIATIQARGGNVIPSFGGYSADTTNTELADSCTDVDAIAKVYESLVTTYGVSRIDLDIEADSINNTVGIDRRNKAIAKVQRWAHHTGRSVEFSYTLPTTTTGLAPNGVALLQNAVDNGARVDVVNIMTFDYYDGAAHDMAQGHQDRRDRSALPTRRAPPEVEPGEAVEDDRRHRDARHRRLRPGGDLHHAERRHGEELGRRPGHQHAVLLGAPARQRRLCGHRGANNCSGIAQDTWYFSHTFKSFTRGSGGHH